MFTKEMEWLQSQLILEKGNLYDCEIYILDIKKRIEHINGSIDTLIMVDKKLKDLDKIEEK